ncbi:hypothetical protein [Pseudooceanicola sp.]|uniref:hypothetical protein n=1 Tax=Pseudooceanicola sp. TaxID=1914328 RepID=UPI00261F9014|nr:hypothetical protein [Pseudooceanicola sp.]MDF1856219.1 hypothetical protein [Pseudooceanicola sp.]
MNLIMLCPSKGSYGLLRPLRLLATRLSQLSGTTLAVLGYKALGLGQELGAFGSKLDSPQKKHEQLIKLLKVNKTKNQKSF